MKMLAACDPNRVREAERDDLIALFERLRSIVPSLYCEREQEKRDAEFDFTKTEETPEKKR